MNKIKIFNKELFIQYQEQKDIQIFKLDEKTLKNLNWIDENNNPTGAFSTVLSDLNKLFPIEYKNNPKIWDPISKGIGFFNIFLKDGNND